MAEHARRRRDGDHDGRKARAERVADDAVDFAKWFVKNKFSLMRSFLPDLERDAAERDPVKLRERFVQATDKAQRILLVRLLVTVLLVLAGGSTVVSTLAGALEDVPGAVGAVRDVAAFAASITLVLILVRLALDRYLDLIGVAATYLAIELAGARARERNEARG